LNGLLEGLEISIARASELERTARLDAEYFRKDFMRTAEILAVRQNRHVADLAEQLTG
jgi:hypothetical protein